ncbi:MAG: serine hydrolase domain-containing protein [Pseudomonadota bacterium]
MKVFPLLCLFLFACSTEYSPDNQTIQESFEISEEQTVENNPQTLSDDAQALKERFENSLAPAVYEADAPQTRWNIYDRMAHHKIPGASIAVFENGEIVWAAGYGVKAFDSKEAVDVDTLFQAASISKHVTSIAGLALLDRGDITLDEPVNSRLETWKIPENDFTTQHPITLRDLLSHTAGLNVSGFPGYPYDQSVPSATQVLDGTPPANTPAVRVVLEPGVSFSYSGGGTTVAQILIEDVTGTSFADALNELVFKPAGMNQSGFWQPLPEHLLPMAAKGHAAPTSSTVPNGSHVYPELGAAGMWSTASDLARLSIAFTASSKGSNSLLTEDSFREIVNGQLGGKAALGVTVLSSEGNTTMYGHTGGNHGFKSLLLARADGSGGIAILTNADSGFSLISELTAAYSSVYGVSYGAPRTQETISLDDSTINMLSGVYRTELEILGELLIEIEKVDNGLSISALPIQAPTKLMQISEDDFILADGHSLSVKRDASGAIISLDSTIANGVTAVPTSTR